MGIPLRFSLLVTLCGLLNIVSGSEPDANNLIDNGLVIQTSTGPVEGKIVKGLTDKDARVFYGIPYAKPPVGDLRFHPPLPIEPWTEVFKATQKPIPCYQFYTGRSMRDSRVDKTLIFRPWSEDCLTLTIWTPQPAVEDSAVLVLFHSGDFSTGSSVSPSLDGSTLATEATNVVVAMNYRLGPFGFLTLGNPEVQGNAGLLDQQLAMIWIHTNIHHFGGKTKAIILVGAGGAGSASIGYHLVAESSAGLFRTISLFSGAPTCSYAFNPKEKAISRSKKFAELLECSEDDLEKELQCLRKAHPEDIVDIELILLKKTRGKFKPTVDGTFISESPNEAMEKGHFNKNVAVMVATNPNEASLIYNFTNPDVMANPEQGITIEGFRKSMKRLFSRYPQSALNAIEEIYIDPCSSENPVALREAAISAYSDELFECCINEFIEAAAKHGAESYRCIEHIPKASLPAWVGSPHAASIPYVLGYPLGGERYGYTSGEGELSKEYMKWIAEYTQKKTTELGKLVPAYNVKDKPYLFWNFTGMVIRNNYRGRECLLRDKIVPMLKSVHHGTCGATT